MFLNNGVELLQGAERLNILGHTRFSIYDPKSASWRLSRSTGHENEQRYIDDLYAPSRMNQRLDIFLNHTLPTLDLSKGHDNFFHVVSYSEELPDRYKHRLYAAAQQYDWLRLDLRTRANRRGKPLDDFAAELFERCSVYAEFRLDDDDILSTEYFSLLRPHVNEHNAGKFVSPSYGIQAFYESGHYREARLEHRPMIALGLARICTISNDGTVRGPRKGAHTRTDLGAPVIVDGRKIAFLHTMHLAQDSGVDKPDDDLGRRFRNYLNQPKPEGVDISALFPSVCWSESFNDIDKTKLLFKSHGNRDSLSALLVSLAKRLRHKITALVAAPR